MATPSHPRYDVLLQGNQYCDLTFTFTQRDSLPLLGQETYADDFAVNAGGIFNLASTLTRLGIGVGLVTQLGADLFSRFIAERMQECGLSLELTSWVEEPLPVVTAGISFPHDRLFISYAAPRHRDLDPPKITPDDLDRYRPRALFTFGEVGIDLCREARSRGILVYVDAHWNLDHLRSSYLRELLQHVDVFSPNLPEALEITGAGSAEEALDGLSRLCRCVAIKCGSEGCLAWRDGERIAVPAIAVQAVETTGAGDNFNAGLIYGLLHGYPFERCLRYANVAGGLSTQVLGGCGSGVRAADLEAWSAGTIPPSHLVDGA